MKNLKIKTNTEIKKSFLKGYLSAKTLIEYLVSEGFKTSLDISKTSLNDLTYKNKQVKNVSISLDTINIKF